MTVPAHVHHILPVAASAQVLRRRLLQDGDALVARATGQALGVIERLARTAGLAPSTLPSLEVRPTTEDELGCLAVRFTGDEDRTVWPATTLWLAPTEAPDGTARLAVLSPRHPDHGLRTPRLDRVWRERLARTAVRAVTTALVRELDRAACDPTPDRPAVATATLVSTP